MDPCLTFAVFCFYMFYCDRKALPHIQKDVTDICLCNTIYIFLIWEIHCQKKGV